MLKLKWRKTIRLNANWLYKRSEFLVPRESQAKTTGLSISLIERVPIEILPDNRHIA